MRRLYQGGHDMRILGYVIGLVLASALVHAASAQQIESVKVSDSIHMLTGKGGNIGVLIGEDGTFMIDDKFAPMTDAILAKVTELGGSTPRFVINTHFHGDHTGGNENLGKAGSAIISHANVRKRLTTETVIKAFNKVAPPQPKVALPIVTFTRDISFHLNGETVNIVHVPAAHTDGDSIVHFLDANVIHAGDTVFNGFFPFIDTDHGGTVKGVIASVDKMLALADDATRIIPGHGPLASKTQLREYRDMLATVQERLGKLKAAGKTAAQAVAEKSLADLDAKWGNGMFKSGRWIEIIYNGI